jgi:small GTP-binding protein
MHILRCQVCLIGDCQVGKTALSSVFHKGKQFPKSYLMTTGVDLAVKSVKIPDTESLVELYLFDTAGSPIFAPLRGSYWTSCFFLMAVFDVTNRDSFVNLKGWISECKKAMPERTTGKGKKDKSTPRLYGVLVAAKNDLRDSAAVTSEEANQFAVEHGLAYFECSALNGTDVEAPFQFLANSFHVQYEQKLKLLAEPE